VALMVDRERAGREASPSAAVVDSQSVKAPHAGTRRYDTGKKIVGRKRHIAVDTDGRLLMVKLDDGGHLRQRGDADDSRRDPQALAVGEALVRRRRPQPPADAGQGHFLDFVVEIIRRSDDQMQKPAYSYIRFSSAEQALGDSYRRQREKADAWAAENGYVIRDTLEDLGVSAFRLKNLKEGPLACGAAIRMEWERQSG
jgi:hypothetical protein